MYQYHSESSFMPFVLLGILVVAIVYLIAGTSSNTSTYTHPLVGDVVMPVSYNCDFGVLYNDDGIPMVSAEGGDPYTPSSFIGCEDIVLTTLVWKITPKQFLTDFIVEEDK